MSTGWTARTTNGSVTNSRAISTDHLVKAIASPYSASSVSPATIVGRANGRSIMAFTARLPLKSSRTTTFRRIILPNLVPAIVSGVALAFARAVGEFGSVVLISGNKPFDTQVASVYAYKQLESDNITGAAAVSVVLLGLSLLVLVGLRLVERRAA